MAGESSQFRERVMLDSLLVDLEEIIPMQSSEFIKSMYFGSELKIYKNKSKKMYIFHLNFYKQIFWQFKIGLTLKDLNVIFSIKPSGCVISNSVETFDKKLPKFLRL